MAVFFSALLSRDLHSLLCLYGFLPAPLQRETMHLDDGNTAQAGMSRFGALSCIRAVKLDVPVVWVAVPNMNRR